MKMIDEDHMTEIILTEKQVATLKACFDRQEIENVECDTVHWEECIDGAGNLCLDEDAFDQCKEILGL